MRMESRQYMKTKEFLFSLMTAATLSLPTAHGAGSVTPRTDINPALLYWQAFSLYPNSIQKNLLADPPVLALADAEEPLKTFDRTFGFDGKPSGTVHHQH